jgi:hypothetical protein
MVWNSENQNENDFYIFLTVFYFSTFNLEYPEFKIQFQNLVQTIFGPLEV